MAPEPSFLELSLNSLLKTYLLECSSLGQPFKSQAWKVQNTHKIANFGKWFVNIAQEMVAG